MKRNAFVYLSLFMSMFILTACPSSDDDDEETPRTDTEKPLPVAEELKSFVGFWEANPVNYPRFRMFLFEDRKCWIAKCDQTTDYSYGSDNYEFHEWNYNAITSILSITNNNQWIINMVTDEAWMGITVGGNKEISYTAERWHWDGRRNSPGENIFGCILRGSWKNVSDSTDILHFSFSNYDGIYLTYKGYSHYGPRGFDAENCIEDKTSDKITINTKDEGSGHRESYNIEIIHPYNYEHVYLNINSYLYKGWADYYGEHDVRENIKGKYVRVKE